MTDDQAPRLDVRAKDVGMSMASLARAAAVPYHKIWGSYPLKADERQRIETEEGPERRRLAAELVDQLPPE